MFADKLKEMFSTGDDRLTYANTELVNLLFDGTRMVSVHDDVVKAALPLMKSDEDKMKSVAKYTCWPDYNTWIEFKLDDRSFGLYFHGERGKSVMAGHGLVIVTAPDDPEPFMFPFAIDLDRYSMTYCDLAQWAFSRAEELGVDQHTRKMFNVTPPPPSDPLIMSMRVSPFLNELKPILLTILAFMNSPKLIRTREVDMARLNARRLKRGKYPYHPHHEVRLNIDKHVAKITQGQGDGPERCLHFVRAHLRFLVHPRYKNVSVVLVPPHHRGNPELGIMKTSYAVDRENSRWPDKVE